MMSVLVDMNDFDLREVSLVPEGMNELADAPVAKEKQPAGEAQKRLAAVLTSENEGHQHGIHLRRWGDEAKVDVDLHGATAEGDSGWHEHDLLQAADGSWTVGMAAGHTHKVDGGALSAAAAAEASPVMKGEAKTMDEELENGTEAEVSMGDLAKLIRGVSADVKGVADRTDRLERVGALPASERVVFDGMTKEAQDVFLAADSQDRTRSIAETKKAEAEKALGGGEDPMIAELRKEREEMAKERQEMAKAVTGLTAALRGSQLDKEAEEVLSFAPGKPEVKQAVLGKMHELAEENPEVGKEALSMLKALNDAGVYNWSAFGTQALKGVGSGSDVMKQAAEAQLIADGTLSEPLVELNKMAVDYQTAHPDVTKAKSYQLQAGTVKGRELLASHYASTPVRMA